MLKNALDRRIADLGSEPKHYFKRAQLLSAYILEHGSNGAWLSQHVILLHSDIVSDPGSEGLMPISVGLLREVGLFPYLDETDLTWKDRFARNGFRHDLGTETGVTFHRAQSHAFRYLARGRSVVLSAPTSFGKSFLIDATIATTKPKMVVVVVPTLSLLDEQRRRLSRRFGSQYRIIYRNDQSLSDHRNILILTQERLRERDDIESIDFFVVDEFYKLNAKKPDSRNKCLNIVFSKYSKIAKQMFLLGPNVESEADFSRIHAKRIDSDSVTVASVIHKIIDGRPKTDRLIELLRSRFDEKTIIFCRSPESCRVVARALANSGVTFSSEYGEQLGSWLGKEFHPDWIVSLSLKKGIGMHHGSMPRSVGQQVLSAFDTKDVNVLICTSSLIEGVNTKAKNVIIFDKKISTSKFDYFSYKNISGRAGRFGAYMVGNVFLLEEPPAADEYAVEIPSLSDASNLSDDLVIGLSDFATEERFEARRAALVDRYKLPLEVLSRLATYSLDQISAVADAVRSLVKNADPSIMWRGADADYEQVRDVLNTAWAEFATKSSFRSGDQAAFYAFRLLYCRGSVRRFLDGLLRDVPQDRYQIVIDTALKSMREVDFHVPEVLRSVELIVNYYADQYKVASADYSSAAIKIENQFLPPLVKALDEIGIPVPLGLKIKDLVSGFENIDDALRYLRATSTGSLMDFGLTEFEAQMITLAAS